MPVTRMHLFTRRALATLIPLLVLLAVSHPTYAFDWQKLGQDLFGGSTPSASSQSLPTTEIAAGLKDALRVGTERVVGQLGTLDGFNADPQIHIPLPQSLTRAKTALGAVGMGYLFDDLELKLNRAAEESVPEAKTLFWNAIEQMTLEDVKAIYNGPNDAATRYFQAKMTAPLSEKMKPLIDKSLAEVGAIQAYDAAIGQYRTLPFVPDVKANLTSYVIEKGMDGMFYYLAKEEAAIRENPAKRTTELLQKVFGAK